MVLTRTLSIWSGGSQYIGAAGDPIRARWRDATPSFWSFLAINLPLALALFITWHFSVRPSIFIGVPLVWCCMRRVFSADASRRCDPPVRFDSWFTSFAARSPPPGCCSRWSEASTPPRPCWWCHFLICTASLIQCSSYFSYVWKKNSTFFFFFEGPVCKIWLHLWFLFEYIGTLCINTQINRMITVAQRFGINGFNNKQQHWLIKNQMKLKILFVFHTIQGNCFCCLSCRHVCFGTSLQINDVARTIDAASSICDVAVIW